MQRLKTAVFLLCLTISSIAWCQPLSPDSTINIARWKVVRLAEIALRAQACDSLVRYQEKEINAALRLQMASDSLIANQVYEIVLSKAIASERTSLYKGQIQLTQIEKKKKRKWVFISLAIGAGWILREFVVQ